jgi:hypothetical protein
MNCSHHTTPRTKSKPSALNPHLKAMGPIIDSQPIGLLYFIGPWMLNPHLMLPLYYILPHVTCSFTSGISLVYPHTYNRPAVGPTSHRLYSSKTPWHWVFLPYTFAIMGTLRLGLLFINKTILADGHLWCWILCGISNCNLLSSIDLFFLITSYTCVCFAP